MVSALALFHVSGAPSVGVWSLPGSVFVGATCCGAPICVLVMTSFCVKACVGAASMIIVYGYYHGGTGVR